MFSLNFTITRQKNGRSIYWPLSCYTRALIIKKYERGDVKAPHFWIPKREAVKVSLTKLLPLWWTWTMPLENPIIYAHICSSGCNMTRTNFWRFMVEEVDQWIVWRWREEYSSTCFNNTSVLIWPFTIREKIRFSSPIISLNQFQILGNFEIILLTF